MNSLLRQRVHNCLAAGHRRHSPWLAPSSVHSQCSTNRRQDVLRRICTTVQTGWQQQDPQAPSTAAPAPHGIGVAHALATLPAARLRVAVDVDEVLGRFVYALNQYYEAQYGVKHEVSDYWVYEYAKIWGCSQDQSNHIVHDFFKSPQFKQGIPTIPGALPALQRLAEQCDLVVVTSRQHAIQGITLDWIDRHYPGIFQEVYFGNHWSLEGVSRKKSDICMAVGASVLVDDNPIYATECAAAGIQVLLYDWNLGYPWSKLKPGQQHSLITVVQDWQEVEQHVGALVQQQEQQQHTPQTAQHRAPYPH